MDKLRPLLVAVPAFALGCLVTASLTTSAKAAPIRRAASYEYKVVGGEGDLNSWGAQGYEYCGESATTGNAGYTVERRYTMRRAR